MINKVSIRKTTDLAVFVRNHQVFLKAAVERNKVNPSRLTTFRARSIWKAALEALQIHKTIPVYFAPVGGKGNVEYIATLHHIKLHPERDDAETEKYLSFAITDAEAKGAGEEGLWEKGGNMARTLYTITHCEQISYFPFTELIKLTDGKPISANYGYSYCMVHQHTPAPGDDFVSGPDEVSDPSQYSEGTSRRVSVNVFERSKIARQKCLEYYGLDCVICGFNFGKKYGDLTEGFIHVHHLKSLSDVNEAYKVDPVEDLRPVCPNCHAVIHSSEKALTIDQVKKMTRS